MHARNAKMKKVTKKIEAMGLSSESEAHLQAWTEACKKMRDREKMMEGARKALELHCN